MIVQYSKPEQCPASVKSEMKSRANLETKITHVRGNKIYVYICDILYRIDDGMMRSFVRENFVNMKY
jgi:hypothetical protein